jgi:hypothetical protein
MFNHFLAFFRDFETVITAFLTADFFNLPDLVLRTVTGNTALFDTTLSGFIVTLFLFAIATEVNVLEADFFATLPFEREAETDFIAFLTDDFFNVPDLVLAAVFVFVDVMLNLF